MNEKLNLQICAVIHDATRQPFELHKTSSVGGGSINEAYRLEGKDGRCYFLKFNDARHYAMFVAEAAGLDAIAATDTIRVPRPVAHGIAREQSYLVLEHLELSSRGDAKPLGEQLAALHRCSNLRFGFHQDNFIGTTAQPNAWTDDWIEFWREQRFGSQLRWQQRTATADSCRAWASAYWTRYPPSSRATHRGLRCYTATCGAATTHS